MLEGVSLGKTYYRGFPKRSSFEIRDISLTLHPGEALGLLGPSGSGKSTVARMLSLLLRPSTGSIRLNGTEISTARGQSLRHYRRNIQIIFQDPHLALDPKKTIAWTLQEPLWVHGICHSQKKADHMIDKAIFEVGLSGEILKRRPGEISGGQAQRVAIARAISLSPQYLIADEATSMLDLSVQAMILKLLESLMHRKKIGILVISHDPFLIDAFCGRSLTIEKGSLITAVKPGGQPVKSYEAQKKIRSISGSHQGALL